MLSFVQKDGQALRLPLLQRKLLNSKLKKKRFFFGEIKILEFDSQ